MAAAGANIRYPVERLSAMGFAEVLATVPRHVRLFRDLNRDARAGRYAAAILIDYPGFHLRLGRALRRAGVPVVWYIAPQLWAWRPGRLAGLRAAADRVAVVLPFETAWFGERDVAVEFVGHPLLDRAWCTKAAAREQLGIPPDAAVLGMFPGTREAEVTRNWPLFRDVGTRMLAEGRATRVIVAGTAGGYYPDSGTLTVQRDRPDLVMAAATAVLLKSGSTGLEAAWMRTPMVVAYRSSWSTYAIARRVLTVRWISLANLIAGRKVVPEFWHLPVRAEDVGDALRPLLDSSSAEHQAQLVELERIRSQLGPPGAATRVATMALDRIHR